MSKGARDENVIIVNDKKEVVKKSPVEVPKEYWATNSPYIDAYIKALNYANCDPIDTDYSAEEPEYVERKSNPVVEEVKSSDKKAGKKEKKKKAPKFYKKRKFMLVLLSVLMVACIAVAGISIIEPIAKYTAPFVHVTEGNPETASYLDPIYSLIKSFVKTDKTDDAKNAAAPSTSDDSETSSKKVISFTEYYKADILDQYQDFEKEGATTDAIITMVLHYAFPIVMVLFLLMCLYLFIKAIVALASKKDKKIKLGFSWFIGFLFLLGIIVFGMVWNGFGLGEIKEYFMAGLMQAGVKMEGTNYPTVAGMGLGLYIEAALMVVSLIVVILCYKKVPAPGKKGAAKSAKKKA